MSSARFGSVLVKAVLIFFTSVFLHACTSGSDYDVRNKDVFQQSSQLSFPAFTTTPFDFSGNIQSLVSAINGRGDFLEATCAATAGCPATATIEGIVMLPSDFGLAIGTSSGGCALTDTIFSRSFVLADRDSAILVAYGKEPPTQDTAQLSSATYITKSRNASLAVFGNRISMTVLKVQKYGGATGFNALVTDFDVDNVKVISSGNSSYYGVQSGAFTRASDLYRLRRLEGYITATPMNVDCPSGAGTRQFQFNYQTGYEGKICVGATSYSDAQTCTGGKTEYKFKMSKNLGAGTLSGFDTGNSFSYTLAPGAKVRMTGPVFPPQFNQADSNLSLMLGQKLQVETLK